MSDFEVSGERILKYERVFPRLCLEKPLFLSGEPIKIVARDRVNERCDLLARLVHASGRTYAQTELTLSEDVADFGLGKALNILDGDYEIWLTPPLNQFHGQVPVERRIPCHIAASSFAHGSSTTIAQRRQDALYLLANRSGVEGTLARLLLKQEKEADRAALNEALRTADAALFFASFAATGECGQALPGGSTFTRLAVQFLQDGTGLEALLEAMKAMGTGGFANAALGAGAEFIALCALSKVPRTADMAMVLLDKFFLCQALRANRGIACGLAAMTAHLDPLSALCRLQWGIGSFAGGDLALLALAATEYQAPDLLAKIAISDAEQQHFECHGDTLLQTWRHGDTVLFSAEGQGWQARIGSDFLVRQCGQRVVANGHRLRAHADEPPHVPLWATDEAKLDGNALYLRCGSAFLLIGSTKPLAIEPREDGAGEHLTGGSDIWFCSAGSEAQHGSFDAFCQSELPENLDLEAPPRPEDEHMAGPHVTASFSDGRTEIHCGDHGLILDFT